MKRKILLIGALILVVLTAGLFYVNRVLLPVQIKGLLVKTLSEQLNRTVTLGALAWNPVQGVVITDLSVAAKDDPSEVLLHIPSASAQVLMLPFLEKKIIIPGVHIDSPTVRIVQENDGLWNFSDLLEKKDATGPSQPPALLIRGISVTEARIDLVDRAQDPATAETIGPVNIRGSVSLPRSLHVSAEAKLPATNGRLEIRLKMDLRDRSFEGGLKGADIDMVRYLRFIPTVLPVVISSTRISSADLALSGTTTALNVAGDLAVTGSRISLPDGTSITGDLTAEKTSLSSAGKDLSLEGVFRGLGLSIRTSAGQTLAVDWQVSLSSLIKKDEALSAQANVWAQKASFTIKDQVVAAQDLMISGAQISSKKEETQGRAALTANGLSIKTPAATLTGEALAPALLLKTTPEAITLSGDIRLEKTSLALSEGPSAAATVSLKGATVTIKKERTEIAGDVLLDGAVLKTKDLALNGTLTAPGTLLRLTPSSVELRTNPNLKNGTVALTSGPVFTGSPGAEMILSIVDGKLSYGGTITLAGGTLTKIPTLGTISDIRGRVGLEPDRISTRNLSLTTLNTAMTVTGSLSSFQDPMINAEILAPDLDLAMTEQFAPDLFKEHGLEIKGKADVTARIEGPAGKIGPETLRASAVLKDVSVDSKRMNQAASHISGSLEYNSPTLTWKDLSLQYRDRTLTLNGYLQDFLAPYVATTLTSSGISVDTVFKKTANEIRIDNFTGGWLDSSASLNGTVLLEEQGPLLALKGSGKLALRDMKTMLPSQADLIDRFNPAGVLKFDGAIKGPATAPQQMTIQASFSSPALSLMGYRLENMRASLEQKNGQIDPLDIKFSAYNGTFEGSGTLDTGQPGQPFTLNARINDIDMALLKAHSPLKNRQISGTLAGEIKASGTIAEWDLSDGEGLLRISNGYLWEIEILSRILSILSTSLKSGDLIITDAGFSFTMEEGRVQTNDLTLKSAAVTLLGEGWVDLNQNVDLNITPRINAPAGTDGEALTLIDPTAGLMNIQVKGTVTKPVITHNITAPVLLKKTLQNTVGNILKIFE
ncbi:MAG: AsmA family protein [Elusimicrobia bacterium]|nr:AsmA family protein [Elusimicrobiota bacterium]